MCSDTAYWQLVVATWTAIIIAVHGRKLRVFSVAILETCKDLLPMDEYAESRQTDDNTIYKSKLVTMRIAQMAQCLVY
jgi:hypothetical protein